MSNPTDIIEPKVEQSPMERMLRAEANNEKAVQLRCYLCDTPKADYSLTHSFREVVCRGCVNFEGPDRVDQLILSARKFKSCQLSSGLGNNDTNEQNPIKTINKPNEELEPLILPPINSVLAREAHHSKDEEKALTAPVALTKEPQPSCSTFGQNTTLKSTLTGLSMHQDINNQAAYLRMQQYPVKSTFGGQVERIPDLTGNGNNQSTGGSVILNRSVPTSPEISPGQPQPFAPMGSTAFPYMLARQVASYDPFDQSSIFSDTDSSRSQSSYKSRQFSADTSPHLARIPNPFFLSRPPLAEQMSQLATQLKQPPSKHVHSQLSKDHQVPTYPNMPAYGSYLHQYMHPAAMAGVSASEPNQQPSHMRHPILNPAASCAGYGQYSPYQRQAFASDRISLSSELDQQVRQMQGRPVDNNGSMDKLTGSAPHLPIYSKDGSPYRHHWPQSGAEAYRMNYKLQTKPMSEPYRSSENDFMFHNFVRCKSNESSSMSSIYNSMDQSPSKRAQPYDMSTCNFEQSIRTEAGVEMNSAGNHSSLATKRHYTRRSNQKRPAESQPWKKEKLMDTPRPLRRTESSGSSQTNDSSQKSFVSSLFTPELDMSIDKGNRQESTATGDLMQPSTSRAKHQNIGNIDAVAPAGQVQNLGPNAGATQNRDFQVSDQHMRSQAGHGPVSRESQNIPSCSRAAHPQSSSMAMASDRVQSNQSIGSKFLKCLSCHERLDDRHYVQCPSVSQHKFCFDCSRISLEKQRDDFRRSNNSSDQEKIFCPSGNKCSLPNEASAWTFMSNEIETIFRESARQMKNLSEDDINKRADSEKLKDSSSKNSNISIARRDSNSPVETSNLERATSMTGALSKEPARANEQSLEQNTRVPSDSQTGSKNITII